MGAWGYGILQNDTAQDGLVEIIRSVEEDISKVSRRRPEEAVAARLGGAVGVLLHMNAWFAFDPEKEFYSALQAVLQRQQSAFTALPRRAVQVLEDVIEGKGPGLVARSGRLDRALRRAFFRTPSKDFSMERVFGKREPALFEHAEAAAYVQEVANRCAEWVDEEFEDEEVVSDLSREGEGSVAALATVLVLDPCHVKPQRFKTWRKQFRAAMKDMEMDGEEGFLVPYHECLEISLQYGIDRFSTHSGGKA